MNGWLKRVFRRPSVEAEPRDGPYRIRCLCGRLRQGPRLTRHQVLTCEKCGKRLLVFPRGGWPPITGALSAIATGESSDGPSPRRGLAAVRSPWFQPVLAAALTLLIVLAVLSLVLPRLVPEQGTRQAEAFRVEAAAARGALEAGDLATALAHVRAAAALLDPPASTLTAQEAGEALRLRRQLELIADLAPEPLEDAVARGERLAPDDWRASFTESLEGRAVVFDTRVSLVGDEGIPELDYVLVAGDIQGQIDVSNLDTLHRDLAAAPPSRRYCFGVRIASCQLEADPIRAKPVWTVRFQPDSFTPLTEPALLAILHLGDDTRLREVVERQRARPIGARPDDQLPVEGLAAGATSDAVLSGLGQPSRIARQVVARKTIEQWTYDDLAGSRLLMERKHGDQLRFRQLLPHLPKLQKL